MTGIGPVVVRQPRVHDRDAAAGDPGRIRFTPCHSSPQMWSATTASGKAVTRQMARPASRFRLVFSYAPAGARRPVPPFKRVRLAPQPAQVVPALLSARSTQGQLTR
jgi:hypothetical protein